MSFGWALVEGCRECSGVLRHYVVETSWQDEKRYYEALLVLQWLARRKKQPAAGGGSDVKIAETSPRVVGQ